MTLTEKQKQIKTSYEKIIGQTLIEKNGEFYRKTKESNGKETKRKVP
jgi:hypothetical protein